jgi:3-polyprenyl-4-hydroxybenzoate decarboxylase
MNDSSIKTKILLGITGSVAAIKGPELALALSTQLNGHVVVLLTQGGEHFWNKAENYNPKAWNQLYNFKGFEVYGGSSISSNDTESSLNVDPTCSIVLPLAMDTQRKIILFRELQNLSYFIHDQR